MSGSTGPNETEIQLARAVWFLALVAKKMRNRVDGSALVVLPARYVAALRELVSTAAGPALQDQISDEPQPATPKTAGGSDLYLAMCGAERCVKDVWETSVYGSPCPVCGNTDDNTYDSVDSMLAEGDQTFGPVIYRYSRADAIADRALIDVTPLAAEAGFRDPVAVTAGVWRRAVAWPDEEPAIQHEEGRLWDVVYMAAYASQRAAGARRILFGLSVVPRGQHTPQPMTLVCDRGPDDHGRPVITIMLPEEA